MMPILTVIAKVVAKKGSEEAVKAELLKVIEPTRLEEGCIGYFLHQDLADPAQFIFYENWINDEYLDRHMDTEHFRHLVNAISGITEEIAINRLARLENSCCKSQCHQQI
jgi:quinol monooxygenase YgiN